MPLRIFTNIIIIRYCMYIYIDGHYKCIYVIALQYRLYYYQILESIT